MSQAQVKQNRVAGRAKATETTKTYNDALEPGMAASHAPWSTQENKALIAAFEDHGNKWKDVAKAVGSRTWQQCRRQHGNLKRNGRLVPISKTTPLVHKLLPGLYEGAFNR